MSYISCPTYCICY